MHFIKYVKRFVNSSFKKQNNKTLEDTEKGKKTDTRKQLNKELREKNIEDMKQAIPPLLLIPLVENAFKHGVSETRNQPFVNIHLSVREQQLLYVVKNSSESTENQGIVKENIGLSNLRRQLELLYEDYDLTVFQGDSDFIATLKINLKSHV